MIESLEIVVLLILLLLLPILVFAAMASLNSDNGDSAIAATVLAVDTDAYTDIHEDLIEALYSGLLERRREAAALQLESGMDLGFPDWHYKEISERQIEWLSENGPTSPSFEGLTRGEASDVIGLFMDDDYESEEFLAFSGLMIQP